MITSFGGDHAEVAVACLAGVNEEGRSTGRGKRGGYFAADVPGFAHPGHDKSALRAGDHLDRGQQNPSDTVLDCGREVVSPAASTSRVRSAEAISSRARVPCSTGIGFGIAGSLPVSSFALKRRE